MRGSVTQEEACGRLEMYLKERSDLGLVNLMWILVLEPQNPFAPEARQRPRAGFVLAVLILVSFLAWFAYFNLTP